jgi:nicotinamide-nucleotide adenylyltransferase
MSNALFLGRFQPPTLGHMDAVAKIISDGYQLIIGVGSVNRVQSRKNPFTKQERTDMLELSLTDIGVNKEDYQIVYIRDVGDNKKWLDTILPEIPKFDVAYSGSGITRKLFRDKGLNVTELELNRNVSATNVREIMYEGKPWEHLVTESVADYIKDIKGVERLCYLIDCKERMHPVLTVDIITNCKGKFPLIRRKYAPDKGKLALPGGGVDPFETPKQAANRESKEEINMEFEPLGEVGYYSDDGRDPRGPYLTKAMWGIGKGEIKAGDDAASYELKTLDEIRELIKNKELAFDHGQILQDFLDNPEALKKLFGSDDND